VVYSNNLKLGISSEICCNFQQEYQLFIRVASKNKLKLQNWYIYVDDEYQEFNGHVVTFC